MFGRHRLDTYILRTVYTWKVLASTRHSIHGRERARGERGQRLRGVGGGGGTLKGIGRASVYN